MSLVVTVPESIRAPRVADSDAHTGFNSADSALGKYERGLKCLSVCHMRARRDSGNFNGQ